MEDIKHSADWKLGYCRAALETILNSLKTLEPSQFGPLTYAKCLAENALDKTK